MFLGKNTSHGKDATVNNLNAWGLDSATDHSRVHEAQRHVDVVLYPMFLSATFSSMARRFFFSPR